MKKESAKETLRPPIVAIVGHIDHGKSTLLDYIRKTNVVAGEAGGITQRLSAYEAVHETQSGPRTITFLDTPGHEAFTAMRSRGLSVADVAVLVVSAEEGAKTQTLEAAKLIEAAHIPYIVAFTKIDREAADIERAKLSLLEHGIYLEGQGGTIPFAAVSGKTGAGVPELLDLIVLAAEMEGLHTDPEAPTEGVVIEAHIDSKRGASATLIIKNGILRSGTYVVAGAASAPVRILEDFLGTSIREARAGSPVRITGFSSLPKVGSEFRVAASKKEAEAAARAMAEEERAEELAKKRAAASAKPPAAEGSEFAEEEAALVLPVVIKTDAAGIADAIVHEIEKLPNYPRLEIRIVSKGAGSISEADVKLAAGSEYPGIVVGFNVKVDAAAQALAERLGVVVATFDIIYKLAEWLAAEFEKRRPRSRIEEPVGSAKILKVFSSAKHRIVLGGRVESGVLKLGAEVRVMRRDLDLGRGTVQSLQSQKIAVKEIEAGDEFGAMVKTDVALAAGDLLEAFEVAYK